jgi:hypothetical protein
MYPKVVPGLGQSSLELKIGATWDTPYAKAPITSTTIIIHTHEGISKSEAGAEAGLSGIYIYIIYYIYLKT